MIHPPKLDVMVQALGPRLGIVPVSIGVGAEPFAAAYMEQSDDSGYQVVDGIAIIPIQGVLTKAESWVSALSGCSSYAQIGGYRRQRQAVRVDGSLLGKQLPAWLLPWLGSSGWLPDPRTI
jgi:hypothetical protein